LADFKDERAYDSQTLTKVFLWSSLGLLVCVGIMAWKDYSRPWRSYQCRFMEMERAKTRTQYQTDMGKVDWNQVNQLKKDYREARIELRAHQGQLDSLVETQAKLDAKIYSVNMQYKYDKADIGAETYDYSKHYLELGKTDKEYAEKIQKLEDVTNQLNEQLFVLNQEKSEKAKEEADITAKRDDTLKQIKKMESDLTQLRDKYKNLSFDFLFAFRNAMLLNFLSPTITIQQIMLKNLPEDMYFAKTMRVDRCITCHLAIDKKGYEDAPEPFTTHPHLELYLGSASPHPINKIGCTICHGGVGSAVGFNSCAHVPDDEAEAKRWKREYDWSQPEDVDNPMLPLKYAQASCLKCHGTQEHIDFAPKLDRGRELMVTRGCVGCHKVANLENLPKAGMSLIRIRGKLQKDFILKWVWNPHSFNAHARMPSFFQQSNNSDPEDLAKTKAELHAVVDYIYDRSEDFTPPEHPGPGSVSRGKKLFETVGCLACHGIDDMTAYHADFAPDLSSIGSKVTPSWLYSWVRNPDHYDPNTRMPSLRLSTREASDITAYLMTKKNKDFEELPVPEFDPAVRDGLILDYLDPQVGLADAKVQLAGMDEAAKDQFLGEKTLNKYGCFACHLIKGYENSPGIGTELSTWGSKQIGQLDFGFTDVPHTHEAFLEAKLSNPRVFDTHKVTDFKDRLKMPNFYLSDDDREAIITAVLGLTQTYVPDEMMAGIHGDGPLLEKGDRVISAFNCRGCHLIGAKGNSINELLTEGQGGRILQMYKAEGIDYSMGPPNLNTEGAKLQVKWFHDFLLAPHPIRPWLHIRMPTFNWTDEKLSDVITYFNLKDDQVFPFHDNSVPVLKGRDLVEAKALFNKLQCAHCHIVGAKQPVDLSSAAPDLLQVHERLKPEWILTWLKDPSAIMPDTRMVSFWPDDVSPAPEYFHGDSAKQREALRDYLFMMGENK
jgi:cytochrome c2